MKRAPTSPQPASTQRGATLMLMLVILILGSVTFLVTSLSKATLSLERNQQSSDLLAKSKDAIIGYLVGGGSSHTPGWMSPPDVLDKLSATEKLADGVTQGSNYDGQWEAGCFNKLNAGNTPPYTPLTTTPANMKCLGRLPWKGLGLSLGNTSENDPLGVMPWIAFSSNLMNSAQPINSDLLNVNTNWLTVRDMNGNIMKDAAGNNLKVAFIIIIPGAPLAGQTRPLPPNLGGPQQYLDSITVPAGCTAPCQPGTYSNFDLAAHDPFINGFIMGDEHRWIDDPANPGKQIEDSTYQFNDKLLYVTIDELMPLIEKRIAREVKQCLDDYAAAPANTGHKYPWPVLVSDTTAYPNRTGDQNVLFGRLPEVVSTSTGTAPTGSLLTMLQNLQSALTNFKNNTTVSNLNTLINKGDILKDNTGAGAAHNAGVTADSCTMTACDITSIQNDINTAMGADGTMPSSWNAIPSCNTLILTSSYWADWRDLVFYQIANGYQPGAAGSCTAGTTCLTINGSGNPTGGNGTYRAAVAIAGKWLAGQTRPSTNNPPSNYLENAGGNNHQSSTTITPATTFNTYKPSDTVNYTTVNDLVICVDGDINCK